MLIGLVKNLKPFSVHRAAISAVFARYLPHRDLAAPVVAVLALTGGLVWTAPEPYSSATSLAAHKTGQIRLALTVAGNEGAFPEGTQVIVAKPPVIRKTAGAARPDVDEDAAATQGVDVATVSAQELFSNFRRIGYRLEDLRKGVGDVPRVFVKAMPKDIGLVRSIPRRKAVFIKTMLPLILSINETLRATRDRVQDLAAAMDKGAKLKPEDKAWLAAQYDRFDVKPGAIEVLLRRIDVIPPSLAMAQGAEESGWGSSRFALEGRALFGQRTFKGRPGIVPHKRGEGENYKVRTFNHLLDGVRSYVHNLNTHPAYGEFRALRAKLRADASGVQGIDSLKLVEALKSYSERGEHYVKTIKAIIRFNNLKELDDDRLKQARDKV
jgi:Bax protein